MSTIVDAHIIHGLVQARMSLFVVGFLFWRKCAKRVVPCKILWRARLENSLPRFEVSVIQSLC